MLPTLPELANFCGNNQQEMQLLLFIWAVGWVTALKDAVPGKGSDEMNKAASIRGNGDFALLGEKAEGIEWEKLV